MNVKKLCGNFKSYVVIFSDLKLSRAKIKLQLNNNNHECDELISYEAVKNGCSAKKYHITYFSCVGISKVE